MKRTDEDIHTSDIVWFCQNVTRKDTFGLMKMKRKFDRNVLNSTRLYLFAIFMF